MVASNQNKTQGMSRQNVGDTVVEAKGKTGDTLFDREEKQLKKRKIETTAERQERELRELYSSPPAYQLEDGTWVWKRWVPDSPAVVSWKEKNFGCNFNRCFRYACTMNCIGIALGYLFFLCFESLILMAVTSFLIFIVSGIWVIPLMEKLDRNPIAEFRKIESHRRDTIMSVYYMSSAFVLMALWALFLVTIVSIV